jgi:hypothetical protein
MLPPAATRSVFSSAVFCEGDAMFTVLELAAAVRRSESLAWAAKHTIGSRIDRDLRGK